MQARFIDAQFFERQKKRNKIRYCRGEGGRMIFPWIPQLRATLSTHLNWSGRLPARSSEQQTYFWTNLPSIRITTHWNINSEAETVNESRPTTVEDSRQRGQGKWMASMEAARWSEECIAHRSKHMCPHLFDSVSRATWERGTTSEWQKQPLQGWAAGDWGSGLTSTLLCGLDRSPEFS